MIYCEYTENEKCTANSIYELRKKKRDELLAKIEEMDSENDLTTNELLKRILQMQISICYELKKLNEKML